MAWSVSWPFSRSPFSDPALVSFYLGMSAQIANSYRAESDWLGLSQEGIPWTNFCGQGLGCIDWSGLSCRFLKERGTVTRRSGVVQEDKTTGGHECLQPGISGTREEKTTAL